MPANKGLACISVGPAKMSSRKEPLRGSSDHSTDLASSKRSPEAHSKTCSPFSSDFNPQHDSSSVDNQASVPIPDRGHGRPNTNKGAMDPFEVRIRFTQHLQHLNASVTSANKAAQYAIKYRDMDEDLHSCILEQLERVSPLLEMLS